MAMRSLCGTLSGILALLVVAPLAVGAPPSWGDQINKPRRFKVLQDFGGAAVLDQETGLVWEQSPDGTTYVWSPNDASVIQAALACANKNVRGRKGWRLPSINELASLIDPSAPAGPTLPAGHPFTNVQSSVYWSATTFFPTPLRTGWAWVVNLSDGSVGGALETQAYYVWCVRGGGVMVTY